MLNARKLSFEVLLGKFSVCSLR